MSNKALEIVLKKLTLLENWKRKESELDDNLKEDLNRKEFSEALPWGFR